MRLFIHVISGFLLGVLGLVPPGMVANATIELELTQGISAALPIAIPDFTGAKPLVPGNEVLEQVIRTDLKDSGQFRVLTGEAGSNEQYWRSQKIDNVVTGTIEAVGGQYQVRVKLVNLFSNNDVLLDQTFRVPEQELRGLAHHISDLIYEKITGVRGIFSTRIAYVLAQRAPNSDLATARYILEVSDADGFNPKPLLSSTEPIMSPTWSPNGRQIAYVSFEGHRAAIYIQDLSTGQRRVLSAVPGINGAPAFSPDGSKLALVLTKTESPKIYVLNLGTGQLTSVTQGWSIDTEPAWSADGNKLLFTSNRDGKPQIYQYNFMTGQTQRISFTGDYNARSSFTRDAKSIIMMHGDNNFFGIARQDVDSGKLQVLVQTGRDESPSVAPNGKMIIYATQYGGHDVLAQISSDGRVKLRLPAREGDVREPAWSPFL